LEIAELQNALDQARKDSNGLDMKAKSKAMHSVLDVIAREKNYYLKLRK